MAESYFSDWELQRIYDFADYDIDEAYNQTLLYIEKYPNDLFAKINLAELMCCLNRPDFESYLYQLERYFLDNIDIQKNYRNFRAYVEIQNLKMRLYFLKGEYQKAYDLYLKNKVEFDKKEKISGFVVLLKKKLGILDENKDFSKFYYISQVIDYDEERFLDHIKKHLVQYYSVDDTRFELGLFNEQFPLEVVFSEIKSILPNSVRLIQRTGEDLYCFKYDNCGRHKNLLTDYFCLVAIHDTCDFITMYPTVDCNKNYCIDLNYLNKECNDLKSSYNAVERFNRRLSKFKNK